MYSSTLPSLRTLSVIGSPNSHHISGPSSWTNCGYLWVWHQATTLSLMARWKEQTKRSDASSQYSAQRIKGTGLSSFHGSNMPRTLYGTLPHNSHSSNAYWVINLLCFNLPFPWDDSPTDMPAVDRWYKHSKQVQNSVHQCLEQIAQKYKHFNDHHRGETPNTNQVTLLSTKDIWDPQTWKKLTAKYIGPFKISKKKNQCHFQTWPPQHCCLSPTFYVSCLKPAILGPLADNLTHTSPSAPLTLDE